MAVNISSAVCPPLPPPPLECCHELKGKNFIVHHMNDVSVGNTACERPDNKTVVHRCLASLMSSQAYVVYVYIDDRTEV